MFSLRSISFSFVISCGFVIGCGGNTPAASGQASTAGGGASPSTTVGVDGGGAPTASSNGGSGGTSATPAPDPTPTTPATPSAHTHHRCGWIGADTADAGAATFAANAAFFDAVHPVWFDANADGSVTPNHLADDPRIVTVAHAHGVLLMPLVSGGGDATVVRAIMASPASISAHVTTLVNLTKTHNYDGLEIDYEHLWQASDRPTFMALTNQLAEALHAAGKTLSFAVPVITTDNGGSAYDYVGLVAAGADVVHLMGYDYHAIDSDHQGPLAPLGWLDAVAARVQSEGVNDHVIMGVGNYGVGAGWYVTSIAAAIAACGGTYSTVTNHMSVCSYGTWTAGTSPHCTTPQGDLWFEDVTSIGEKAKSAASHQLLGIGWYTLGAEPTGFLGSITAAYPH